ncbi:interleukin-22 receptor subunit alpha-1 [Ochotona curzoniae]|uniref:interleukin-22 receptor subunit alpha-1 n=1 Tax=Ochotona curzoniae TaxID=130825 RepID=UPI001B351C82|nr:interleukin-22 receptor subunit alpha-1 [Ochotona curzoniae]
MRALLTFLTMGSLAAHIAEEPWKLLQHVKFQSSNFENILTWDSGPDSTPDTVYSVEYKTYGEKSWLPKAGCQLISQRSCNLTTETSKTTEFYYARVTAMSTGGRSATKMTERFSSLQHTTIKPPDVTCIPKVRSVEMIVHPSPTPIQAQDGHQLTLNDIFKDLFYRVELRVNHTYQRHLGGKQRQYEFLSLTPDTEFLGSVTILVPTWSKESAPYVCRVKTLPDRTWVYSFSGIILFFMGFLMAGLCYLSYRYVTKPPAPPNSLNVQRVLTFQPLRFLQEHVLIPVSDFSGPSSLAQPMQYDQIKVSDLQGTPGTVPLQDLPETAYVGQPDVSILRPSNESPPQTPDPQPSHTPKTLPEVPPPSYAPQVTAEEKPPAYTPQAVPKSQTLSYVPQDTTTDSWLPSYGICVEGPSQEQPPETIPNPTHLWPKCQISKEVPTGSCIPGGLSLREVTSPSLEDSQEAELPHLPLGLCTDSKPDPSMLHSEEPGTPHFLGSHLPLLSSVQIEGHPAPLLLSAPSPPCSPSDQGPQLWSLLDSLVCPKDEGLRSETEATSSVPENSSLESPVELDSLFRGLALTVQWES